MRIKNHKEFACFDYISEANEENELGDILYRKSEDGEEIGVVIQTFKEGDNRTDMWGVDDVTQLATIKQILRIRPLLVKFMEDSIVHIKPMIESNKISEKYLIVKNKQEFFEICENLNCLVVDDNEAGGIGYDYRITFFDNK